MGWLLLIIAGFGEIVWASFLKYADSITDWAIIAAMVAGSFILLIRSYKTIPIAVAYTVFVGIGTIGTYFVGIYLGEPYNMKQIIFLFILMTGILGLKLTTEEKEVA
ncbi:DMT family transporter [Bacillus sp. FSL K6-3431]|uniref:DMT family transporter n=1 Tax=Bacillus sp. FSL K6-3431 TaxID=2921500 RepID=UPI0030F70F7E